MVTASKNELGSFEILLSNRLYLPVFGLLYQVNCNEGRKREIGSCLFFPRMSQSPCSLFYPLAGQESKASERWSKTSQKAMGYADISIVRSELLIRRMGGKINGYKKYGERWNDSGQAMMEPGRKETEETSQELLVTGFNSYGYSPCQYLLGVCLSWRKAFIYCFISQIAGLKCSSKWRQQ